jgi:DNA-binding NarL/FixJ family response regulator
MHPKILLLDDHRIFAESLKVVLETKGFKVKNVDDAEVALKYLTSESFDIVITDIEMPKINGIDFIKKAFIINQTQSNLPKYVVVTSHTKMAVFQQLYTLGIDAYLSKKASPLELFSMLKKVLKGEKYFEKSIYDDYLKGQKKTEEIKFTKRELEVLKLILEEYTTAEIAEMLLISPYTVEGHRKNLLQKTNSKNVVGLIKYSLLNNLG